MVDTIKIPSVDKDGRIGSAFNHLFRLIFQMDETERDNWVWDLGQTSFFHPFFLAPLVIYKQVCQKNIRCINKPSHISNYLDLVCFDEPLFIAEDTDIKAKLETYTTKTYLPVCRFSLRQENLDGLQSILQRIMEKQSNADHRIVSPLSYMLGELVDNMKEHSCGCYGYIFSQYLKKEGCIDLVLADDGITIFGSYAKFGLYQDKIQGDESIALRLANEGKSTKNLPNTENRGYGISSSKQMLVDGLNGSFFMLSGSAFHRHDAKGSEYVQLPDNINWHGTIILMRIPVCVPKEFDYAKYTQG